MTLFSLCSVVVLINVLCYIVCSLYHKYIIVILTRLTNAYDDVVVKLYSISGSCNSQPFLSSLHTLARTV